MIQAYIAKVQAGQDLSREDALRLLTVPVGSPDWQALLHWADEESRKQYKGRGYAFAQIGLDAQPCPVDCGFCALAASSFSMKSRTVKTLDEVLELADALVEQGADELFLMTTACFPQEDYLTYAAAVRKRLPASMPLVANVGDFGIEYAKRLRDAGFTGAYHIRRLGEGTDTLARPSDRLTTLDAIRAAGLDVYYCVEPIGPEHTPEELAAEIFRGREYAAPVMAVMKRVRVPGTPLFSRGEISPEELARVAAVAYLCSRPSRAMGVHEPDALCLTAGANQIYAEASVNPRDLNPNTEESRGFSLAAADEMLAQANLSRRHRAS